MADETIPEPRPAVTRKQAKAAGLMFYFTGKACPHGHLSARYVSSHCCLGCQQAWSADNPGVRAGYRIKSEKTHPGRMAAHQRKYYERNRQDVIDAAAERRKSNPEACVEYQKQYYKGNIQRFATYRRNRRARLRANGGKHTAVDIDALFATQKGKCAHSWCRVSIKGIYHVDHIKPLALGGSNDRKNLQLLCQPCNQRKRAKHPIDFAQQNGMLL